MKVINFANGQEGSEWLSWRKTIITATEAASIMGLHPYVTAWEAYRRKVGEIDEIKPNHHMMRGKQLEPIAREIFIKERNMEITPQCIESDEYYFLGCSLDGISNCGTTLLEIKCPSKKNHDLAIEGKMPQHYECQIQHQLICSRAKICHYMSYFEGNHVIIDVYPDEEFEKFYIERAKIFWNCVLNLIPPVDL